MLKVLMFPGRGNKNENRFLDVLVRSLAHIGVSVFDWPRLGWRVDADVFHVHWPELVADIRMRPYQHLRGRLLEAHFFSTIKRVKDRGGRVVWTIHDVSPHKPEIRNSLVYKTFFSRFISEVDVTVSLTNAGSEIARAAIPELNGKTDHIVRHPHYKDVLKHATEHDSVRAGLGISGEQTVFSLLGSLRENKGAIDLISAVNQDRGRSVFSILAGHASDHYRVELERRVRSSSSIYLKPEQLTQDELIQFHNASDWIVFPATEYFNSGSIYAALSLNVPVLAVNNEINREIQSIVGLEWLRLFDGKLSYEDLMWARKAMERRSSSKICNLSEFDPTKCARDLLDAYQAPI